MGVSGLSSKAGPGLDSHTLFLQPTTPKALQDITNLPQPVSLHQAREEKKWTRVQRPSFLSEDLALGISLGKRPLSPPLEDPSPAKRRASQDSNQNVNLSQTAAVAPQPRRVQ